MLAQTTSAAGAGVTVTLFIVLFVIWWVILTLPTYAVFKKAGMQGWEAFVPIYAAYILLKVVGRPGWWLVLIFVPVVNVVVAVVLLNDLSKSFGKGVGFTLGLVFLSWIFMAILGWGNAQYLGAGGRTAVASPPMPPSPA